MIIVAVAILAAAALVAIVILERNSKTPQERYSDSIDTTVSIGQETSDVSYNSNETSETNESTVIPDTVLNTTHTVEYEILSYDIIEDVNISTQTKYTGDNFYDGCLPDPNYLKEYTDYQAMRKDYPQYDEYLSSNGEKGMTSSEYQKFMKQHLKEYTTQRHPKTKYVFLHCRITNISSKPVEEYINDMRVVVMSGGKPVAVREINCYFDKSQNTDGDDRTHSFLIYVFKTGETIECVLGCCIEEDERTGMSFSEDNKFYAGFLPIGLDNPFQVDPVNSKGFIALDKIPKES